MQTVFISQGSNKERGLHSPSIQLETLVHQNSCGNALGSPGQEYTSIRLAYVHNWGDVAMSCAPVIAGVLITLSRRGVFDAAMALGVTVGMCWSMLRELLVAPEELFSPGILSCGHAATGRISLRTKPSV